MINTFSLQNLTLWKAIHSSIGIILIAFTSYQAATFPSFSLGILAILSIIFFAQLFNPYSWLIYLPICLIAFDFSAFSGRFIFNEFDFIMLTIIGAALVTQQFQHKIAVSISSLLPFLLTTLAITSINFHELWGAINTPLSQNPYYSGLYSFKITKGLLYGLILALLFHNQYRGDSPVCIKNLIVGSWLGSLTMFFVVLWERHTLVPLLDMQPWWAIASSLLDFTSSYRVTGLLSDMHTGGEAIDGIYLLLIPLNLFGFYWFERTSLRFISLIALFMVCYCVMVGFTRATYFSMAISLLSFAVLFQLLIIRNKKILSFDVFIYLVILTSSYIVFINSGYVGIVSFCAIVFTGFVGRCIQSQQKLSQNIFIMSYSFFSVMASLLAIKNHFDSRWVTQSTLGLVSLLLALVTSIALIYLLVKRREDMQISNAFLGASSLSVIALMLAIALGGSQINTRMTTISKDIQTRLDHWQSILISSNDSTLTTIIGNGVGSMPLNYVLSHPETVEKVGSFSIQDQQLVLGTGDDLAFGQRITIEPNTEYNITIDAKGQASGRVSFFLCERNVIFASNFIANCSAKTLHVKNTSPALITTVINSEKVGLHSSSLMRWPTLLYIKNTSKNSILTIGNISLTETGSEINLLNNGDFTKGLDHWFFYNDFQHLPWHIKNIYLSIYYQLGLLGLLLLALMLIPVVKVNQNDIIKTAMQVFLMSYLLGMFSFGLFGDPLDSARANVYFFMLLFAMQFINPINNRNKVNT